jgi:hypothetical protein
MHPDEMHSVGESHSDIDFVVMDCVLSRTGFVNMNKKRDAAEDRATPVQPCAFRDVDAVDLAIALRGEMEMHLLVVNLQRRSSQRRRSAVQWRMTVMTTSTVHVLLLFHTPVFSIVTERGAPSRLES